MSYVVLINFFLIKSSAISVSDGGGDTLKLSAGDTAGLSKNPSSPSSVSSTILEALTALSALNALAALSTDGVSVLDVTEAESDSVSILSSTSVAPLLVLSVEGNGERGSFNDLQAQHGFKNLGSMATSP